MAIIAVLIPPTGAMRIGMCADIGFMTYRTTRSRALAGMAVQAMILAPAGIVGQGPGICMTGIAGILLMTDQASRTIPLGLNAMCL